MLPASAPPADPRPDPSAGDAPPPPPLGHPRASAALRHLARREDLKAVVLTTPALYAPLRRAAARYVAGETRDEALATARALAAAPGAHRATIDFMGEDTRAAAAARAATDEFLALVDALGPTQAADDAPDAGRPDATSVSLDLSHIGLAVSDGDAGERLAAAHLAEIAAAAEAAGREVVVSMEGSARTDAILRVHAAVAARHPRVGVTLQAALHRTPDDLARLLARGPAAGGGGRIRLVKGAYAEPTDRALPRGAALDARYAGLARTLLDAAGAGRRVSIATHDPALLAAVVGAADVAGGAAAFDARALQFEMLHGVSPDRLDRLAAAGYATRVYLVYGREWWLYLCHRLAEHPPALLDALADVVDALPRDAGAPGPEEREAAPAMIGSSARPGRR